MKNTQLFWVDEYLRYFKANCGDFKYQFKKTSSTLKSILISIVISSVERWLLLIKQKWPAWPYTFCSFPGLKLIVIGALIFGSLANYGYAADHGQSGFGYSWWIEPLALQIDGKVIAGAYVGEDRRQVIYSFDPVTGGLDSEFTLTRGIYSVDDHSAPAVMALTDGRLVTVYTGHGRSVGDDGLLRLRVSSDMSPDHFGSEVVISDLGDSTYAQLYEWGGSLYAISQHSNTSWWLFEAKLTDLSKWTRLRNIIEAPDNLTQNQIYILGRQTSGPNFRFYAIAHPNNIQNELREFDLRLDTGSLVSNGRTLGNFRHGDVNVPVVSFSNLERIRTPAANHSQRLLDVSDSGNMVVVVDFTTDSDGVYYLGIEHNLGIGTTPSWDWKPVMNAGSAFNPDSKYFAGVAFAREFHNGIQLYAASYEGGVGRLERMLSIDGGDNWTGTNLRTITSELTYPVSPRGATDAAPVFWQEGEILNFNNWHSNTVFLIRHFWVQFWVIVGLLLLSYAGHFLIIKLRDRYSRVLWKHSFFVNFLLRSGFLEVVLIGVFLLSGAVAVFAFFDGSWNYHVVALPILTNN